MSKEHRLSLPLHPISRNDLYFMCYKKTFYVSVLIVMQFLYIS